MGGSAPWRQDPDDRWIPTSRLVLAASATIVIHLIPFVTVEIPL